MAAKYVEIAEKIRNRIQDGSYPANSLLPTEQQLCDSYGVSRQTVRQALQLLVEENLIFRRQGSGSRVLGKSQESGQRTVAILTTYISDYIFPSILREAEAVLSRNNCSMMLYATSNQVANERRILQGLLREKKLDGVLVEGTKTALPNPNLDLYTQLQNKGVPLVFFNASYRDLVGSTCVLDDNIGGGRMLVDYLHGKGHSHIAGIFKSDDIQGHLRYQGYLSALRDRNLPMEDRNIFWYDTSDRNVYSPQGDYPGQQVLSALKGCTAVICYNDEVANALSQFLLRRGTRIPQDIAIVSFDNSHYSDLSACRVTSLSHGSRNVGRVAAEALIQKLSGANVSSQTVPWLLVEKESS